MSKEHSRRYCRDFFVPQNHRKCVWVQLEGKSGRSSSPQQRRESLLPLCDEIPHPHIQNPLMDFDEWFVSSDCAQA